MLALWPGAPTCVLTLDGAGTHVKQLMQVNPTGTFYGVLIAVSGAGVLLSDVQALFSTFTFKVVDQIDS